MSSTDVVRIGQQGSLANAQTNDEDQGRLKAELQYLRRLRAAPPTPPTPPPPQQRGGADILGAYQGRKCAGCGGPFGRFYNTGASCSRCRLRVCRQCRVELRGPPKDSHWMCNVCCRIAEVHAAAGEWIYESLEHRGSGKAPFSPVDILKRSIRRAWTINEPPARWSAARKSPELRIYRSLPSRHQNYRQVVAEKRVGERESSKHEEPRDAVESRDEEESSAKALASHERARREEKGRAEEDVPLKDEAIKLKKSSTRTRSEEDVQEQSSPRVSLIKPPRILSKLISPDIKSAQPKHGDRKSNIPVFRRSSKEFEDIKSPQEVSKRSLIPQRYRGSTDDLRRSREDISLPSLIPKLLSPRNKEERLKRQDSKDDVRPVARTNRKDDTKSSFGKEDSASGKSGLRIFRRDLSREETNAAQHSRGGKQQLSGAEETKSKTCEQSKTKVKDSKENREDPLENTCSRNKSEETSVDLVGLVAEERRDEERRELEDAKTESSRHFEKLERSDCGFGKVRGEESHDPDENLEFLGEDRARISRREFFEQEESGEKEAEMLKEAIDDNAKRRERRKDLRGSGKEDAKDATMDEGISSNDLSEEFENVKGVPNSMRDSTDSLTNNNEGDAMNLTACGERKSLQDSAHGKKMEDFQVIRRKFSKEEFSNPDDTDDTPNKRCSSHLSPEASPLSTRSSRYSPRESESEPTPALPRKTAGDSSSASQRIRDAISRTRRESNSSARYESSGSESVRFSETGLHGYVELARKVKFFGGNGSGAVPSNIAGDEIVQRDSATSAGEDEPHDDCHGRSGQLASQGRTMLRRRRQFDAQGSRRRGRSHARICCAEELQSLQTLQVVGRGDGRQQASPTNNPNGGQPGEPIVDYRRLVFISSDSSSGREEDDADSSCSSSSYLNGLPRSGGSHAHSLEDCDWDYFESGSLPLPPGVSCAVGTDAPGPQDPNISQDWSCCPGRGSSACQACGGSRGANVLPVPVPIPVPVPYPVPVPASLWTGDFAAAAAASSMISRSAEAHSASEPGTLRLRGEPTAPWFAWHPRFGQHLHAAARFDPRLTAFDPTTCTFRPEEVVNARFYGSVIEAATIAASDSSQDLLLQQQQQQEKARASREDKDEETKHTDSRLQEDGGLAAKGQVRSVEQNRSPRGEETTAQESRKDREEEADEEKDEDEEENRKNDRKDSLSSSFEGRGQRMFPRSREDSGSSSGRSSADSSDLEEDSSSHRFSRVFVVNDDSLTSDNDIEDNGDEEEDSDSAAEGAVTLKRVTALPEEEPVVLQHIRFLNEDACFENSLGKPSECKDNEGSKGDEEESGRCAEQQPERRGRRRKNPPHDEEKRFLSIGSHKLPEEMYLADDNDGAENPIELRSIKSLDPDSIEIIPKTEPKSSNGLVEQKNREWSAKRKVGKCSESLKSPKDDSGTEVKSPSPSDAWDSTIIPDSLEIPQEDCKKTLQEAVRTCTPNAAARDHETRAEKECGSASAAEILNRRAADNDGRDKDVSKSSALDSTIPSSGSNATSATEVSSDELHEHEVDPSSGHNLVEEIVAAKVEPRRAKTSSGGVSKVDSLRAIIEARDSSSEKVEEWSEDEKSSGNVAAEEIAMESKIALAATANDSRDVTRTRALEDEHSTRDEEPRDLEEGPRTSGKVGEVFGSGACDGGACDGGARPVRGEKDPLVAGKVVGTCSESGGQVRGGHDDDTGSGKVSKPDDAECNNSDDADASSSSSSSSSAAAAADAQKLRTNFGHEAPDDGESVVAEGAREGMEITEVENLGEDVVYGDSEANGEAKRCNAESTGSRYVAAAAAANGGKSGEVVGCAVGGGGETDGRQETGSGEVRGDAAERGSTRFRGSVERRPSTRKENGFLPPPAAAAAAASAAAAAAVPLPTRNPSRDAQPHFPSSNNNNKYRSLVMITQEAAYQPVSVITSDTTTLLQPDEVRATSQGLAGYFQLALEAVTEQPSRKNGQPPRRPLMVKRSPGVAASGHTEIEADSGLSVGSASESDDVSLKNSSKTLANGPLPDVSKFENHEERSGGGGEAARNDGRPRVSSQSSDENSGSVGGGIVILEEGLADDDSWVEEVSHDEDEPGATTATEESSEDEANNLGDREEELRGYHRQAIDFTLHTIVEESCEESEAEPSLAAGSSPSKKQRPPSASELEKYFFFGLGDGNNSSAGSREVDSLSETSSIYSEGLESLGQDEGNGTPQGQERSREEAGFLNSSRLEKYFLSEFLGFDQDRRDSDGSVGSDSEGRPSPEAQRRKRLVRARGTGRSHSSSLDNLLALTQSSQNLSSQNSLQDLSLNPDSQETQSEGSSTETDGAEDGQTPVFGTDGQFDTVKRKKKKPRNLGTQSPRVPDDRNKTPEPSREMTLVGEVVVEADGEAMNSEDSERAKTPQPESVLSSSSSANNAIIGGGSSISSSVQNDSSRNNAQGGSADSASYNQRSKQQSRDSGFVGSCDDLLQHQKSPEDAQQNGEVNQEAGRNESNEKCRTTRQASHEISANSERGNMTKLDHPLSHASLPHLPTASLSRKDSFNNWSSDEETNLMMSKMRQFFKTMVANSNGQGQPANSANSSAASPAPSPRLPGYSSKARLCAQNRTKPPQLVYFENELTRLMKTVPGIRDEQVREIVEYLSSEDTWSDSYDSSDYTSSDLEGAAAGGRRSALQEQISQSCQQIISKFDTASSDGLLLADKEREEKSPAAGAGAMQPPGLGRDTAFVYQKLVQSFTKMTGDGVSSDASSTPHSSPPLIAKVMHHIGSRLVALMHEVSEGGPAVQHHSTWRRYSQHHRTPSSASTTEDDDSTSDSTNPPPPAHLQLPRSKSHDPLLLINNHPTASAGQEGEEREASDYERFSWRGSFESALMAGDSRTKLSLLACSGDVSVAAGSSASALAMAAKRRSAGDLLFNPKSFSREQLDRVRSCGSIGGGGGGGVGASAAGGSIEERIWSNRRRSSVPDANTRGESGASAGDEDTEDELEYGGGESRATTLPRGMQSGIAAATNSLPRLPASTVPSSGSAQSPATSASAMHKAHSVYHFLPQHSGVKSARYRPPGFARNSNTPGTVGGPKRALSAPGLQVSASQGSAKRENSRSRRQQAMSLTPDDGSSLSEACSTPIIGGGSRGSSSHTVMDMDDMEAGLHAGHLATRASLSSLGARSDSMASVYSGAGEGRCCRSVVVTGEVEFALQYDYKHLTFEVHVTKCKNLAPVDVKRKRSDPYVKVYLLPDKSKSGKRKTKVKKHTLNPEFNETLKFHMSLSGLETRTLWLTVWHSDMFGRNDFLGEVRMPLENKIFDDPTPRWYPLQERTEPFDDPIAYKGEVIVGLKFVPPDPTQQERERDIGSDNRAKARKNWSRGALHVLVKEARNLQTRGKNSGTCDPFCKSYLLPDKGRSGKQKTGVVRRSAGSPVWGHTFIYKDVSLQELAERGLELTVWDHDRIASNEFLGGVRFNLGTGKHYGKPVDWMDATGRELSLWQSMLERPNFWVEGAVTLRPNLHSHGKNNG